MFKKMVSFDELEKPSKKLEGCSVCDNNKSILELPKED